VRPGWCFRFWSAEQKAITGTAPDCSWLADSLLSSKGSGQRADNAPLPPGQQGSSSLRDRENCPTAKRDLGTSNTSTLAATFESSPDLSEGAHVAN
jgi:hypothetical protein